MRSCSLAYVRAHNMYHCYVYTLIYYKPLVLLAYTVFACVCASALARTPAVLAKHIWFSFANVPCLDEGQKGLVGLDTKA